MKIERAYYEKYGKWTNELGKFNKLRYKILWGKNENILSNRHITYHIMVKIVSGMYKGDYEKMLPKYKLYRKNFGIYLTVITVIMLILSLLLYTDIGKKVSSSLKVNYDYFTILSIFLFMLLLFLVANIFQKKLNKYRLNEEQRAFIYAYKVAENMEDYIDKELEIFKKKALKNLYTLKACINEWRAGNLKFINSPIKNELKQFRSHFYKKTSSIIKHGDEKDLRDLTHFLHQLLAFLTKDNPQIDDFNRLSKNLNELKELAPTKKIRFSDKTLSFFEKYIALKHIVAVSVILFIGFIVYFVGINIIGVGKNSSYPLAVTSIILLIIAYFNKQWKK